MKKTIISLLFSLVFFTTFATITGNGYYRVQNYGSLRWTSLVDNDGDVDVIAGSADLHALELNNDTEYILSDPASIIYIKHINGNEYDISAQGISLQKMVKNVLYIGSDEVDSNNESLYWLWGKKNDAKKNIADGQTIKSRQFGYATITPPVNVKFSQWYFLPVNENSANFFGAKPTIEASGNLYSTLYTSFAYQPYSNGVKTYYIGRIANGMAEMIEHSGIVPGGSPVIIKCAGENAADNKLKIVTENSELKGNSLKGVYFNYQDDKTQVFNQLLYDPETMRIPGICSDGSFGFVTSDISTIPANTAYIIVPKGSPKEFKCVSTETFDSNLGVGSITVETGEIKYNGHIITCEGSRGIRVINMAGSIVSSTTDDYLNIQDLPKGIYIVSAAGKSLKIVR
ncbi:MAG: hypothetical protein J1F16_00040 [Muribaculaceae bacterium]|nr:hypothetical protein [Muribaculaceae bacterium]